MMTKQMAKVGKAGNVLQSGPHARKKISRSVSWPLVRIALMLNLGSLMYPQHTHGACLCTTKSFRVRGLASPAAHQRCVS